MLLRKGRRALLGLCFGSFGGLLAATGAAAGDACVHPVSAYIDSARSAAGDLSALVRFSELHLTRSAVGYGAAAQRSDEITIVDGRVLLVRPAPGGSAVTRSPGPDDGALMLQFVPVRGWARAQRLPGSGDLAAFERALADAVARSGCAGAARLAFRIEGHAKRVTWSLDTLPDKAEITTTDAKVVVVGLYSTIDAGRHAIPAGGRFHAHVFLPETGVAGHLRGLSLDGPMILRLQAK